MYINVEIIGDIEVVVSIKWNEKFDYFVMVLYLADGDFFLETFTDM